MAAKRGKTQARRSGGGGSGGSGAMPGWAWLVIGVAITLLVVMAAPRLMNRDKAGFFRPRPNPDAQPEPVSEEAVVDDESVEAPAPAKKPATGDGKKQDFDFYTLLPGKEVPMTDAELAASEQAEKARQDAAAKPATAPASADATTPANTGAEAKPLPAPVDERPAATAQTPKPADPAPAVTPAKPATPPVATAETRYILQAGAFQASGQAEELKARIALLGLGARVESAHIGSKTVYRVRMGPYGTASELAEAKRKLAGGGLAAMAVKTN